MKSQSEDFPVTVGGSFGSYIQGLERSKRWFDAGSADFVARVLPPGNSRFGEGETQANPKRRLAHLENDRNFTTIRLRNSSQLLPLSD